MNLFPKHLVKKHYDAHAASRLRVRITRDPYVDWPAIAIISLIVAVIFLASGVFAYIGLDQQLSALIQTGQSKPHDIDTKGLTQVLGEFDNRATLRADLEHGYSGPGDPSL